MLSRLRGHATAPPPNEEESLASLRVGLAAKEAANTKEAKAWLTDDCLLRYLHARSFSVPKALDMIHTTILWRASYNVAELWKTHSDTLRKEASSGKMFVLPTVDRRGRAVIVMRPGLENSSDSENNVRYLVYTLERAANLSEDGRYTVLVDYSTGTVSVKTCPSFSVMKETTAILQNHYPERLGAIFFYDTPKFLLAMLKMLRPFIDPATREKLFFTKKAEAKEDENCRRLLDLEKTPVEYGGAMHYNFDADEYFAKEEYPQ